MLKEGGGIATTPLSSALSSNYDNFPEREQSFEQAPWPQFSIIIVIIVAVVEVRWLAGAPCECLARAFVHYQFTAGGRSPVLLHLVAGITSDYNYHGVFARRRTSFSTH
jgi:hypothetical protein